MFQKKILVFILVFSFMAFSCKKEKEKDVCDTGSHYHLIATVDGGNWYANTTLFADKAGIITINGINQNGSSLTLELDDFTVGTFQVKESRNHVLYTDATANVFESINDNPGTLVITSNDESTNLLKGTFNFTGRSPVTRNKTLSSGSLEVFYTE